jgi:hypothetical protein
MHRTRHLAAVIPILLLASQNVALPWGNEGHQIVAQIAARKLTAQAQQNIVALLRSDKNDDLGLKKILGTSGTPPPGALEMALKTIATWPDHMKGGKGETSPWHFIDIGLFEDASQIEKRCPSGACVCQKITDLVANLKTGKSLPTQELGTFGPAEELRFLVHFLGDIHQPLHCATDADAGGNCIKETGYAIEYPELHAVWDTGLVLEVISNASSDTAGAIIREFDNSLDVPSISPNDMAAETFAIAKDMSKLGQPTIPVIDHFVDVNPAHCDQQAPPEINNLTIDARASYDKPQVLLIVRQQLYKGGVRLAAILNNLPTFQQTRPRPAAKKRATA